MMPRGQEASVLDLALPPTSHITKKNHITSLRLNSEQTLLAAKSHIFLSTYFLMAEPQLRLASQSPLSSRKMATSQARGMNIDYHTSILLTVISLCMDVSSNLTNEI